MKRAFHISLNIENAKGKNARLTLSMNLSAMIALIMEDVS